jgi:hypothetical protein
VHGTLCAASKSVIHCPYTLFDVSVYSSAVTNLPEIIINAYCQTDRLCDLVVTVSGYTVTCPGFDSRVPVLNLIKHYAMKAYGGVDV